MANNKNKVILDLCGGTGAWSKPYKDAGYDVRVITLPEYDVTATHFNHDRIVFLSQTYDFGGGASMTVRYADVYGILAAPPCTEFSIAKTTAPKDFETGMQTVRAVLNIIWQCQINGKLAFWAIENPRGLLTRFIGKPAFKFEQWQFGGKIEKPTCLWGYFKEPKPTVAIRPSIEKFRNKISNQNLNSREYACPTCPPEYLDYMSQFKNYQERRAAIRAITPAGFAQAFHKANK